MRGLKALQHATPKLGKMAVTNLSSTRPLIPSDNSTEETSVPGTEGRVRYLPCLLKNLIILRAI